MHTPNPTAQPGTTPLDASLDAFVAQLEPSCVHTIDELLDLAGEPVTANLMQAALERAGYRRALGRGSFSVEIRHGWSKATTDAHARTAPLDPEQRHPDAKGARLCVDCAHARKTRVGPTVMCWHPNIGFSLVNGNPLCASSNDMRHPRFPSDYICGKEGRWFSLSASATGQEGGAA